MSRRTPDGLLLWSLRGAGVLSGAIVLLIALFLLAGSWPVLRDVGLARLFTDPAWHPAAGARTGDFNLFPMVVGSLAVTTGALLLAVPVGVASALFSRFYAPAAIGAAYRRILELLAGIPSVVFGFWGLVVLTPIIRRWQPPGQSLLAGILVLSLMILPTVALLTESALRGVPRKYLDGAAALGLTRWGTIVGVALPAAWSGIATAVLLATARAMGETMAVLMVMGNLVQIPESVFDPARALTANIALELGYAMDLHRSALFAGGLLLLALASALVGLGMRWGGGTSHV